MTNSETSQNRLIPVTKWGKYYDYPTTGAWRQLIFRNKNHIVERVIKRNGGRILIDEAAYFNFIEAINQKEGLSA